MSDEVQQQQQHHEVLESDVMEHRIWANAPLQFPWSGIANNNGSTRSRKLVQVVLESRI